MLSRLFGKKTPATETEKVEQQPRSWTEGLKATSAKLGGGLKQIFTRSERLDDQTREELEDLLLSADVGIETTNHLLGRLDDKVREAGRLENTSVTELFREVLLEILDLPEDPVASETKPRVVMVVGVNGVGKTTSIGKLGHHWKQAGYEVMLAAGDTFRAAATEQLQSWADRSGLTLIAQKQGADAASVVFDALQSARAREADILIADTAGRLQNKAHLMEELGKVVRVMQKILPDAPHEVLLVVDATTGQNALSQAREFAKIAPLTGLIITKMDGTARGGVMLALAHQLRLPVRYLGLGEGIEDLRAFDPPAVVDALLSGGADS